ncbi:MAG: NADH-ubiquinone dehydrogenase [Rhizobiaceae bacterium]|nr:NADH-ubiquinone dehydrogenase [Rhizobiaceae bacterium]MCV0408251.1 NADH-ubiquinone dehydrogenase [Rhizobiaceae bacterium]
MSTPFMPDYLTDQMKQYETMTKAFGAGLPREVQGMTNLMAHPAAMMAAGSAIGMGVASQMLGLWMGSAAGMAAAAQRIMASDYGADDGDAEAFGPAGSSMAQAKAAIRTLVADAEAVSRDASAVTEKAAKQAASDVGKAANETAKAADSTAKTVGETVAPAVTALKPDAAPKPATPDDLKAIAGIGPKLETVLNDLGIWTYDQVAALGEAQIAWLDEKLGFKGRIQRDDWVGQARKLGARA